MRVVINHLCLAKAKGVKVILVIRMGGIDDVLIVKTYLVDVEVPFLCGKQTLESWNFKIDGQEKILEIHMKTGDDNGKKYIKM